MKTSNAVDFHESIKSATVEDVTTDQFFCSPVQSEFGDYLKETRAFWLRYPTIQVAIEADLDARSLGDKRLRQQDKAFLQAETKALFPEVTIGITQSPAEFLAPGRPRTPAAVVFIITTATGYLGSLYGACPQALLAESMSLRTLLDDWGYKLPAPNTIGPLMQCLSESTLTLILKAQLADILDEKLDSFQALAFDSTTAKASSCWPTDSGVIYRLCERACRLGGKLSHFKITPLRDDHTAAWLSELKKSARLIALLGRSPGRATQLKRHYCNFFQIACKLAGNLLSQLEILEIELDGKLSALKPSIRKQAEVVVNCIRGDVLSAITSIQQSVTRVQNGITTKAREKILSLGDKSAAYIEKGGREPVIGYKPQLARSREGFVTAFILDAGNGADCRQLVPLLTQSIKNTGQVPLTATADDGYASAQGVAEVRALGVGKISISGSKGRALLGEALWNEPDYIKLRSERSAIESLMFTLKFNYGFGHPGRRGLAAVRSELTIKILAHNFDRMIVVRERRAQLKIKALSLAA